jgi:hypothetical protein
MYTVPGTTRLNTFLWICAGTIVLLNVMLFIKLRTSSKSTQTDTSETKTSQNRLWVITTLMLFYLAWQIYQRWK